MAAVSGLASTLEGIRAGCYLRFRSTPSSSSSSSIAAAAPSALIFEMIPRSPASLHSRSRAPRRSPRCDAGEDLVEKIAPSRNASISALEQFKVSAANRYMKERSSIAVIGLSIHTAPVEMREKLAVPEALWPRAIEELCNLNHIEEAAVLSTCNRMEIYLVALSWHRGIREVTEWMAKTSGVPVSELRQHLFMLRDSDATRHLFEVSAGLDSLVLGEGQILAQVRQVVKVGQGSGGLGKNIDRLFKDAITAGKRVRTETNISSGAISVSSAAVELALLKLPRPHSQSARMLLIGAGKMGKLVIKHLASKGCRRIMVVNRSVEKVDAIREELKDIEIIYRPLEEMLSSAAEADVVFTSTASEAPLFLKEHVEALPPVSVDIGGSRLFVDISVPRNVGSCVSDLEYVRVYNVDDLKEVVEANKEDRQRKAMEAQAIITEELNRFEAWRDSLETVPTIKKLRSYADRIRASELEKCFQKIGDDALTKKIRRALEDLSSGIVNKLLHGPLQHLRCDGSDSRTLDETLENMHALNRMFSLDTEKAMMEQKIRTKFGACLVARKCIPNWPDLEEKLAPSRNVSISTLEQFKVSAANRYMKERSSIVVIGLSIHTAPVEMREKLAVSEALWPRAIEELCNLNHIEEAAVLSTCNRMEIYLVALSWHRGIKEVTEWMAKTSGVPVLELRQHLFMLRDSDATRHLFEVSAGVDSLVLGEGQIPAQVEQVVRVGQGSGGLGKNIDRLFKDAITAGKRVHSETNISSGAISVSSAAVDRSRQRKAMEAQAVITQGLNQFEAWQESLETVATIKKLISYVDRITASEREKCFQKIGDDALREDIREAIYDLCSGIVNRFLRGPLQHLRCDGSDCRTLDETLRNMHALNRMFSLRH